MQVFEKVSVYGQVLFLKIMSVNLHGLLEPSRGSFPRGDRSSIPRNREYHDTFTTLSRGALLFPQTSLALLHNMVANLFPLLLVGGPV